MKRIKKIAKWTGIVLLVLVAAITTITALRQNVKYNAPFPHIAASTDSAVIARGEHLVLAVGHCMDCHTRTNWDSLINLGQDAPMTGGKLFDLPLGKIYSKNITPDKETGIGRYTDAEIARALRYGVHPDGTVVYDFMAFHNTSDEDLTAIISYLRSRKPVYNKVPDHDLNPLGNLVKAFMIKSVGPAGEVPQRIKADSSAGYGKYLAVSVANCNGCHTQRDMTGRFTGEPFAGGNPLHGKLGTFYPPNLTPDSTSPLFGITQQQFIERFRMGRLVPGSPMPWNSFKRMSDDELKAIYNFLRSTKPVKTRLPE